MMARVCHGWLLIFMLGALGPPVSCGGKATIVSEDDSRRPEDAGPGDVCSCSDDAEWVETSLDCFCAWFDCPVDFESALAKSGAPNCGIDRYPNLMVGLWTYTDCRTLVLSEGYADGPGASWAFDIDTHALIGGARSAWPGSFGSGVCPNLSMPRNVRAGWRPAGPCAMPTYQDLCMRESGSGD
jgi:hypothetical protein